MRPEFLTDGIHPNNAGAQAMADATSVQVAALLIASEGVRILRLFVASTALDALAT
jgi:hypothetical protein